MPKWVPSYHRIHWMTRVGFWVGHQKTITEHTEFHTNSLLHSFLMHHQNSGKLPCFWSAANLICLYSLWMKETVLCCLEIVALCSNTNGRSCSVHAICGEHVEPGDVLRLVKTVVECNRVPEEAIKCIKVVNGVDNCTVSFVPHNCICLPKAQEHLNKFVQVEELCHSLKNAHKQSKAAANCRVAPVQLCTRMMAEWNEPQNC